MSAHHQVEKMSSPNSQLGYCVNCRHSPSKNSDGSQRGDEMVYEIQIDTQEYDDDPLKIQIKTVTVKEILSSIYKLQYLDKLFDSENLSSTANNNNNNDEEEGRKIGICHNCHAVLTQLFKLFTQFNALRVFDSYLSQQLAKLDDLIRVQTTRPSIPATDDNYCGDEVTKIKFEDKAAAGSSSNNDSDSDQVQFMEMNFEEDPHPTSSSSHVVLVQQKKKCKQNTNNLSTVKKTNENLLPVVKVRRLNDTEIQAATRTMTRITKGRQGHRNQKRVKKNTVILRNPDSDDENNGNYFDTTTTTSSDPLIESCEIKEEHPDESSSSSSSSYYPFSSKQPTKKKMITPNLVPTAKKYEEPVDGVCPVCTVSFKIHRNLYKHLLTHIGPDNSCPFPTCPKTYTSRKSTIIHVRSHTQDGHTCPIPDCSRLSSTKRRHREHLRSHWNSGIYICELGTTICEQIFETKALLLSHRLSAHPKIVLKCPSTSSCPDQIFETERQLKAHLKASHPGLSPYSCDFCSKSLASKKALKYHYARHEGREVYRCSRNCGRKFMTEQLAQEHEEKCEYDSYFCEVCAKTFKDKYYFNIHLQTHRAEAPTFKCDFEGCDKTYFGQSSFARHVKRHTGIRPFVCDQCGLSFFTSTTLRKHFIVHSSERPHQCSVCGKRFLRIEGLNLHMTSHSELKQFPCTACDKIFKFSASRHLHFMTVHKEGFSCHVCRAKFPYNINLQKHLATIHSELQDEEDDNSDIKIC